MANPNYFFFRFSNFPNIIFLTIFLILVRKESRSPAEPSAELDQQKTISPNYFRHMVLRKLSLAGASILNIKLVPALQLGDTRIRGRARTPEKQRCGNRSRYKTQKSKPFRQVKFAEWFQNFTGMVAGKGRRVKGTNKCGGPLQRPKRKARVAEGGRSYGSKGR